MREDFKKLTVYFKQALPGLLALIFYFGISYFSTNISDFFNVDQMNNINYTIFAISYEVILLSVILIIFNKKIIQDFKDIKKNHKKYFKDNFKYYLIGLAVMFISNAIIMFILNKEVASNESAIRDMLAVVPIYIYIASVIIAPALEELVFRHGIRTLINNKYVYIIISGLVFGGLHVVTSLSVLSDLAYLVPYCSLGIAFAYIYYKTKNIFVTIGLHTMHNGILVGIQILLLIFN